MVAPCTKSEPPATFVRGSPLVVAPRTKVDSGRGNFPGGYWIICHTGLVDAFGRPALEEVIQGVNLSWRSSAACRGLDPAIFFPASEEDAAEAKAICAGCLVRLAHP